MIPHKLISCIMQLNSQFILSFKIFNNFKYLNFQNSIRIGISNLFLFFLNCLIIYKYTIVSYNLLTYSQKSILEPSKELSPVIFFIIIIVDNNVQYSIPLCDVGGRRNLQLQISAEYLF